MTDNIQERLTQLSPEQRALFFEKLQKRRLQTSQTTGEQRVPIAPVTRAAPLALSFAQQRLWFLDQLGNGSAYNIPAVLHLQGMVKHSALEHAMQEIVRRHESLRTTFALLHAEPYQVIAPAPLLKVPLIDLTVLSADQQEVAVQRRTQTEALHPFDLSKDLLLRVTLIRLASEAYVLLLTMHHIAADGWSLGIFVRELAALYQAFVQQRPSPLPELTIQYADFAHWQRQRLQGELLAQQLAYWKQQLAGAPPLLALPTDHPRPAHATFQGSQVVFAVDAALTRQLRQLGGQTGATLFMTLLAAFQVLLARYTGQEDLVVGTPIANRTRPELEPLIGFFANTLALRVNLSDNPTFLALLEQVRQVTQAAYEHQELPFERLVEEIQPVRALNYNPLVQVVFALQNSPIDALTLTGLQVSSATFAVQQVRFDLEVHFRDEGDHLAGYAIYNTVLFEAATIERMMAHFQTLLASIVAQPNRRIAQLPLLTPTEVDQMLVEWNNTAAAIPGNQCLHHWFEAQVERTPDAVAVIDDLAWTYRQLNQRANQLAHYLQSVGVAPEVRVGLCVDRALDLIVGLLGILKAGGAYVPLDPAYPKARLAFMIEDSQLALLVTQQAYRSELPALTTPVFCLDRDWPADQSQENPSSHVALDNLLYVIYTSGSTGNPKGVAMTHRPLMNLMHWQAQQTLLAQPARTAQFTPISFDVSCQEIFTTLGTGGTLLLISEELRRDPLAFYRWLVQQNVERLFLPFVALQQLAEVAQAEPMPLRLREIITAGEQLQITPALAHLCEQTHCTLHNHYGPTESHVVSAFTLTGPPATWPALPPIGRPVANTQLYILDAQGQLCPTGVPGELFIGGDQLARGYLKRPDLTGARFLAHPFSREPGARVYRTGDLVRYRPDGNIEFLERLDDQIKLRGLRIELGEIETLLRQHPAVQATVVAIQTTQSGNKQLVAYLVARPETSTGGLASASNPRVLHPADLRAFLQEQLPSYMIPASFICLDALPLTPNGKIDRRALPAPTALRAPLVDDDIPPRTTTEKTIAQIWCEVMNLEQVSVNTNFFELGGHSLLATQIMLRIRQSLAFEFPLRHLFECVTVATLAERIDDMRTALKLQTEVDAADETQEEIVL